MSFVRTTAAAAVCASLLASSVYASNYPGGTAGVPLKVSNVTITNLAGFADDCGGISVNGHVTATGVTNDANGNDTFVVQLFDDNIVKGFASFNVPVGQTQGFDFLFTFPGPVLTGAPGVGIFVAEVANGSVISFVDPFFPTQVSGCTIGQARSVPSLSTWGMASTAVLVLLAGWFGFRRRKASV